MMARPAKVMPAAVGAYLSTRIPVLRGIHDHTVAPAGRAERRFEVAVRHRRMEIGMGGRGQLRPGSHTDRPAKTHLIRRNKALFRCAKEGLTPRLNGDQRRDGAAR
jgi:hypothetical protein